MKRIISVILAILILLSLTTAFADSEINLKKLSDDRLVELFNEVKAEMKSRGLSASSMELRPGKYIVGEDIEPGTYVFTCSKTEGEKMNDAYSALGDAYSALLEDSSWSSLFGSLGDIMEDVSSMKIEILGDYGNVLKSVELDSGDSIELTLSEKTAVQISEGNCTIEPKL